MNIENVEFETLDAEAQLLTDMVMRVSIIGRGLEQIATPIIAAVGNEPLIFVMPLLNGTGGITGMLEHSPASGDAVRVGYLDGELIDTGFSFQPANV